jgi:putative nucleotidyltransferase with HDIG domain
MSAALAIAAHIRDLPSMPAVLAEVIASLSDEDVDAHALADRIALDQALTAKVLRLANSSFYGLPSRVAGVRQAVNMLGLTSIRTLVTACAVTGQFRKAAGGLDLGTFWRHCVAAAVAARLIALECGASPELAFTAALLHDIGKLVLATALPEQNLAMIAHQKAHDCDWIDAERAVFGIDHAAVGRELAASWRFPELILETVGHHHLEQGDDTPLLAAIVHVASAVAHGLDVAGLENELVPPVSALAWDRLALTEEQTDRLFAQVDTAFRDACQILLA